MALRETGTKWSPPTQAALEIAVTTATKHLSDAWNNPSKLGVGSEIERECNSYYEKLLSWDIPSSIDDKALYQKALWLSWYATWRARDYTVNGWRKRLEAKGNASTVDWRTIQNIEQAASFHMGENWPPGHIPPFDRDGTPAPIGDPGSRALQYYSSNPLFEEGWMLQKDQSTFTVFNEARAVSWCYFGPGSSFANTALEKCWAANSTLQADAHISDTVFEKTIETPVAWSMSAKWSNMFFLQDCSFTISEGGIEQELKNAKFGAALLLKAERRMIPQLHLNLLRGIRNLTIDVSSTNIHSMSVYDCDLKLTVKGLRNSSAPTSLKISRSNVHLICRDSANGSIAIEDCFIHFELESGKIGRVSISDSDIELLPNNARAQPTARFNSVQIGELQLTNSQIYSSLYQAGSSFRSVVVKGCDFHSPVHFRDAKVPIRIQFAKHEDRHCVFHKTLDLSCTSPNLPEQDIPYAEFLGCHFKDSVNFNNREFSGTTSFAESQFDHHLLVHGASLHQDTSFSKATFGWDKIVKSEGTPESIKIQLNSLSNSYRSLRQAMDRNNASHDVQAFHLLQMRTRNHWKFGSSSLAERILGNAYDVISEYGTSFLRPLVSLGGVFVVALIFYLLNTPIAGNVGEIFNGAFTSTFRPFITFSPMYDASHSWEFSFNSGHEVIAYLSQKFGLLFSFVSFIQSVFVVLLIFLLLLAIRRKYQLN